MTFGEWTERLDGKLRVGVNFDLSTRSLSLGGRRARMYFVDGFTRADILEKMMEYFTGLSPETVAGVNDAHEFSARFVPYNEVDCLTDPDAAARRVLSGGTALVVDGLDRVLIIECRTGPVRAVQEPEYDRVMRGARDGFVETLTFNTALIRRRLRDPALTFEVIPVGTITQTDVCLCYMNDRVDMSYLKKLRQLLRNITIPALTMGQESLAECLMRGQWYNPFPRVRYSERPDAAAACIAEGQVVVLVDNSPAAMLLPTSIFSFSQDANDFYFPPLVGSYLRLVRGLIFTATLFLTPIWYWLMQNPDKIPLWLDFTRIKEPNAIPLIVQLIAVELLIDTLKLASLNTPTSLSNALSLVGALVFGEFAVEAGLFVPELLAYTAFVAIASFTQPSHELTYAFKLFRLFLLILTWAFSGWGLLAGMALMLVVLVTTHTVAGGHYLYPLIPFNIKALMRLIYRQPINRENTAAPKRR